MDSGWLESSRQENEREQDRIERYLRGQAGMSVTERLRGAGEKRAQASSLGGLWPS